MIKKKLIPQNHDFFVRNVEINPVIKLRYIKLGEGKGNRQEPETLSLRPRIEHAQVLHPDDFPRFERELA
jgi:hypothetical protein